jgi:hypothetical protein
MVRLAVGDGSKPAGWSLDPACLQSIARGAILVARITGVLKKPQKNEARQAA